ncbi:MAG: ExeM/NucH family extracellular endonuclease [Anaerolineae bacterium]
MELSTLFSRRRTRHFAAGSFIIIAIVMLGLMPVFMPTAQAAVTCTSASLTTAGSAYTQNFDTLSNTAGSTTNESLPAGWCLTESGGGARDNEQYGVDTGGANTGDTYSYGAAGSTDRAFGGLQSGTLIPVIGASFTNNTGCTVTQLDISYVGEEWRLGTAGRADRLNFEYSLSSTDLTTGPWTAVSALDFSTPDTATIGAKNGNAAADRTAVSSTINSLSIANGATFWIRWTDTNASGADDGLSVDDFSLTPSCAAPPDIPPTVSSTTPSNGASNVVITSNLNVTFSEPVTVTGNWLQLACPTSGTRIVSDFTVTGGPSSFNLDPTTDFSAGESCTLTIFAAQVADQDGTPNNLAANYTASFTTALPAILTRIHDVQGNGATSPLVGQTVTIDAIVVGDFQTNTYLNGFYVQEEDADADADPNTSEGVFVYQPSAPNVNVGDRVQVTGTVTEYTSTSGGHTSSLTEINGTSVAVISTGNTLPTAALLTFPMTDAQRETAEGMRVTFTNLMTVAEVYLLGQYGELVLNDDATPTNYSVVGHVPVQYTQDHAPSTAGYTAAMAELATHTIYLDDGRTTQDIDPIIFGDGGSPLTASNTLRIGDSVTGLTGILDERYEGYRIQTTTSPNFTPTNPRPGNPSVTGDIRVASFNVLNYFNGPNFSDPNNRGANNLTEFNRQTAKEVSAIIGLNADVYGLMEMENDGGSGQAIQSLVDALNTSAGVGTYAYIDTGIVGGDAIRVALIYRPAVVQPVGTFYTNATDYPFNTNTRPPLAQMFQVVQVGNPSFGETFIVVVNHLKSKGDSTGGCTGANADAGDGAGCYNGDRVAGAAAMTAWVTNTVIPGYASTVGITEPDVLLIGDFNSYGAEAPIGTITSAGYNYLTGGASSYSYVFDGQRGTLDQAFVTPSLYAQLGGIAEWHINTDEPRVLDYNTDYKSAGQIASLYSSGPYRTSDHDPILIGLSLSSADVSMAADGAALSENGGTRTITVTLHTSAALTTPLTAGVQVNTASSTATETSDFLLSAPSVTFPIGSIDGATQTIIVTGVDDGVLEGDESIALEFGTITGGSATAPNTASLIITDDETAALTFTNATTVTEASGSAFGLIAHLAVNSTLGGAGTWGLPSGQTIVFTVDVNSGTPGTATQGTDYTFSGPQTVTFNSLSDQTVPLPIVDDALLEGDETINLVSSNLVAPPNVTVITTGIDTAVITIQDDESATVSLAASAPASTDESTAPTISVVLTITDTTAAVGDGALGTGITVSVDAVDLGTGSATSGTDYSFTSPQAITLTGTTLSVPLSYTLIDDGALEGDETVSFQLQNLSASLIGVTYGATTSLTTTITDDETATVSFGTGPLNTDPNGEQALTYNIPVVLHITATTGTPTLQVQADMTVSVGGTATSASDFNFSGSPLSFAAGSPDGASQNVSIAVLDDALLEGPETVILSLNGNTTPSSAFSASAVTYTFTINDDDGATISFTLGSDTVSEAQTLYTVTAVLSIPGGGTLPSTETVDLSLVSSTATNGGDFSFAGPVTLSFAAGSGNGATSNQPITLIPDANIEGAENIVFGLGNLQGTALVTLGSQQQFTLNITDDDSATVSFGAASASTPETEGTVNLPVTLIVPNGGTTLDAISVQVGITGGTATNTSDYDYTSPQTVTFAAGSTTTTTNVTVTIHGDTAQEGDEDVAFSLSGLTGMGVTLANPQSYTLTITDDDVQGAIQFQQAASTVDEATAGTINIPVVLNSASPITGDVVFTVSDTVPPTGSATAGGVDYTFVNPSPLTFPVGSTGGTVINIPVNITADSLTEGSETIILTLAITSGGSLGVNVTHTITIQEGGSTGGGTGLPTGPTPTPIPSVVFLCDNLIAQTNGDMMASGAVNNVTLNGQVGNTYCRIIARNGAIITNAAEIGLPSLLNLGVVHAINLYGLMSGGTPVVPFNSPIRMCMRGTGDVLFISAGDVSRTPIRLGGNTSTASGFTCVSVPNSGLVVMVNGRSGLSEASSAPASGSETALTTCQVRTTNQVNLRSTPEMNGNANVLAVLPYDITLTATAYNSLGWYRVIFENMQGYVNHSFVTTSGNCGG